MNHTRSIGIILLCIGLLFSNVANAAMDCCVMIGSESPQMQGEMKADSAMDMPCHEASDSEKQSMGDCQNCDCQHCMQMTVLPSSYVAPDVEKTERETVHKPFSFTEQPSALFHPPKHHS